MKKFLITLLTIIISAAIILYGFTPISLGDIIRSLPLPTLASTGTPASEFIENRTVINNFSYNANSNDSAADNNESSADITHNFGPITEEITSISVESGEELMSKFIDAMNGRAQSVTVKVPRGDEEFYMNELKEQIPRFSDISQMQTKWITYSGSCNVDITYNDSVIIMAYLEGKIPALSSDNQQVLDEALRIHDKLITKNMSDYDKVKAFHDYIIGFNTYRNTGERSHSVIGALIDGQSVCEGYTEAFDLLCYLSGIECIEVDGTGETASVSGPHAWNKVKVDGVWYNVDVTWDDPVSSSPVLRYDYFLISDEKMAQDHQWYLYPHIPSADSSYDN